MLFCLLFNKAFYSLHPALCAYIKLLSCSIITKKYFLRRISQFCISPSFQINSNAMEEYKCFLSSLSSLQSILKVIVKEQHHTHAHSFSFFFCHVSFFPGLLSLISIFDLSFLHIHFVIIPHDMFLGFCIIFIVIWKEKLVSCFYKFHLI